jgi:hypothetical protein
MSRLPLRLTLLATLVNLERLSLVPKKIRTPDVISSSSKAMYSLVCDKYTALEKPA